MRAGWAGSSGCWRQASNHSNHTRREPQGERAQLHLCVRVVGRDSRAHQAKGRGQRLLRHMQEGGRATTTAPAGNLWVHK
jgi:hypothetical protein